MKTKGYSRRAGIKVVEKLAQNTSCVSSAWSKMVDGAKCMVTIEEIYRQKQKKHPSDLELNLNTIENWGQM